MVLRKNSANSRFFLEIGQKLWCIFVPRIFEFLLFGDFFWSWWWSFPTFFCEQLKINIKSQIKKFFSRENLMKLSTSAQFLKFVHSEPTTVAEPSGYLPCVHLRIWLKLVVKLSNFFLWTIENLCKTRDQKIFFARKFPEVFNFSSFFWNLLLVVILSQLSHLEDYKNNWLDEKPTIGH